MCVQTPTFPESKGSRTQPPHIPGVRFRYGPEELEELCKMCVGARAHMCEMHEQGRVGCVAQVCVCVGQPRAPGDIRERIDDIHYRVRKFARKNNQERPHQSTHTHTSKRLRNEPACAAAVLPGLHMHSTPTLHAIIPRRDVVAHKRTRIHRETLSQTHTRAHTNTHTHTTPTHSPTHTHTYCQMSLE